MRLRGCVGWSAPLLFPYDIRHIFSWLGSYSLISMKPIKWHVHLAKTQLSLHICTVWSELSLGAPWVVKDLRLLYTDRRDPDQTAQINRLILSAVQASFYRFCYALAHMLMARQSDTIPSAVINAVVSTASSTRPLSLSMLSLHCFFNSSKCSTAAWLSGLLNTILAAVVICGVKSSTCRITSG